VVQSLLVLGETIPVIGKFAEVLQKLLEVIKQASRNEDAIVRLHDHAVDISEGLLPYLRGLSSTPAGFDDAFNKLMYLLKEISRYISNQNPLVTKAMSATDTNLVTQVNNYIKNLTDRKDLLMDLIVIDTNRKVTYIAEANDKISEDHSTNIEVNQAVDSSTDPFGVNVANSSNPMSKFQARDTYVNNVISKKQNNLKVDV
jgi:hypothetical protein